MKFNFSEIKISNVNLKTFNVYVGAIPEYIPPEKTGDSLFDEMLELSFYREYNKKWNEIKLQRESYEKMRQEVQAFQSIDICDYLCETIK